MENVITYEEFKKVMKAKAEEETGKSVIVSKVFRNNGVTYDGLNIISEECNVNPVIDLTRYYNEYQECVENTEDSIQYVWEKMYATYQKQLPTSDFDVNLIFNFENVRNKLGIRLINTERNNDWLMSLANVPFLDLSIIFYVAIEENECYSTNITVLKKFLVMWGKTEQEILDIALENRKDDYFIESMNNVLREFMENPEVGIDASDLKENIKMDIISNRKRLNGATTILCPNVLKQYAERIEQEKIIIIPTSVHEALLVPYTEEVQIDNLNALVKFLNQTLEPEEVLSDHVYIYNLEENKIAL